MYVINNSGPRTDPWGTPDGTGRLEELTSLTHTHTELYQLDSSLSIVVDTNQFQVHYIWQVNEGQC